MTLFGNRVMLSRRLVGSANHASGCVRASTAAGFKLKLDISMPAVTYFGSTSTSTSISVNCDSSNKSIINSNSNSNSSRRHGDYDYIRRISSSTRTNGNGNGAIIRSYVTHNNTSSNFNADRNWNRNHKNRINLLQKESRKKLSNKSHESNDEKVTKDISNPTNNNSSTSSATSSIFQFSKETKNQIKSISTQAKSIPNIITISRICSTPILCHLIINEQYQYATIGCLFAGISDWLDGYIAKNYNQQTVFGTYLDPLADKFLINSIALSLSYVEILPYWSTALWLGRDVLLIGLSFRYAAIAARGRGHAVADPDRTPLQISPTNISKINTLFQFGTVGMSLLFVSTLGTAAAATAFAVDIPIHNMPLSLVDIVGVGGGVVPSSIAIIPSMAFITSATTILSGLSYIDGKSMIISGNSSGATSGTDCGTNNGTSVDANDKNLKKQPKQEKE